MARKVGTKSTAAKRKVGKGNKIPLRISAALLAVGWTLIAIGFLMSPPMDGLFGQYKYSYEIAEQGKLLYSIGLIGALPASFLIASIHRFKYGKAIAEVLSDLVFVASSPGIFLCLFLILLFSFINNPAITALIALLLASGLAAWATRWKKINQRNLFIAIGVAVLMYIATISATSVVLLM
ncbi:MAG: hypothetical protein LBQ11_00435 [Candidatus Nomurabacteria bacterium]|jgi:hypothetical protein|nr:hypothetical protein [Candidatus Nomurabacteria bacterium]